MCKLVKLTTMWLVSDESLKGIPMTKMPLRYFEPHHKILQNVSSYILCAYHIKIVTYHIKIVRYYNLQPKGFVDLYVISIGKFHTNNCRSSSLQQAVCDTHSSSPCEKQEMKKLWWLLRQVNKYKYSLKASLLASKNSQLVKFSSQISLLITTAIAQCWGKMGMSRKLTYINDCERLWFAHAVQDKSWKNVIEKQIVREGSAGRVSYSYVATMTQFLSGCGLQVAGELNLCTYIIPQEK